MPLTFEQLARDILAEADVRPSLFNSETPQTYWKAAAQCYLDNLEDGYDDPQELIEFLAKDSAAEDMPDSYPSCDEAGYSWHDGPYSEDEWLRDELPAYVAAVRSTYGMAVAS